MNAQIIQHAAKAVFQEIITNKELQDKILAIGLSVFDFAQVKAGRVNLHSSDKATEIALSTCIRRDDDSQTKVAAFVSALYLQHEINRAAQVGGSLLKRFGKSWFPRVKDKELRFALDVDKELEQYIYEQICRKSN
jgi:hypothetical protein